MTNDYKAGWSEALRVLKCNMDCNSSWRASDIYRRILELRDQHEPFPGARADSPLGVELSRIRDRLNALERQPRVTLDGDGQLAQRIEALELDAGNVNAGNRLGRLEQWRKECATAVVPWPADVLKRLDALERAELELRAFAQCTPVLSQVKLVIEQCVAKGNNGEG